LFRKGNGHIGKLTERLGDSIQTLANLPAGKTSVRRETKKPPKPFGQTARWWISSGTYPSYIRAPALSRRVLVTFIPPLLPRMLMNPRTVCFALTISASVAPPLRWIIAMT
jgi:hypothetical protein